MRIIQITDTHLQNDCDSTLFAVNTNKCLIQATDYIKSNNIIFDCIFLTGDISQDISMESYSLAVDILSYFKKPVYWIPGNHDNLQIMQTVFNTSPLFKVKDSLVIDSWAFIFLNTTKEKSDNGLLGDHRLQNLLNSIISMPKGMPICLIMHHHPHPVGTPLIDKYILEDSEEFWNELNKIEHSIRVIMCGHVHGNYYFSKNDVQVISTEATCFQWVKGTKKLAIDNTRGFALWDFQSTGVFSYEKINF